MVDDAYEAALDYLYSFIDFEQKRQDRYLASKLDATRPARLMAALGRPQARYPSLHIAGTKGKGSVAAMCASALRAAGLRVGLYTSPHLIDFRERVRVLTPADPDGRISRVDFVRQIDRIRATAAVVPDITWFEILTAVAFLHFAAQEVDVAVVEVGLGGRLDATNVVTPLVSVITSLSLDHTYFLGDTLAEIAYEKGGIIKPGVPVVTAPQQPAAMARLREIARERQAPLVEVGQQYRVRQLSSSPLGQAFTVDRAATREEPAARWHLDVPLTGAHQQENGTVALAAMQQVQPHFAALTDDAIRRGLAEVSWPGRLQMLHTAGDEPAVLLDCAHNGDSAAKLRRALQENYRYHRLFLIFGASADKRVAEMMHQLFPIADGIIITEADHPRATPAAVLAELAADLGYTATAAADLETAVARAWTMAGAGDLICVTGSIFVVGDLLNQWERLKSRLIPAS